MVFFGMLGMKWLMPAKRASQVQAFSLFLFRAIAYTQKLIAYKEQQTLVV